MESSISLESYEDVSVFHSLEFNKIVESVLGKKVGINSKGGSFYIIHPDRKLKFLKINYCPDPRLECVYGGILGDKKIIKKFKGFWHITTVPGANIDEYLKCGFYAKERFTSILLLKNSVSNLWKNLNKKTRNLVRKGKKNDIKIVRTNSIDEYYKILKIVYKNAQLKILSKEFYEKILNKLGELFLAVYDGKVVAGALFLKFKDKVYYWNGGSYKEYLSLSPNNIIQWEFIKWAKENNFKKYDFLGLDVPSIAKFKEGFGGKRVKFYTLYSKPLYYLRYFKNLF